MQTSKKREIGWYLSFFKKELTENLLSLWMSRCLDKENGGYFNCFTNDGSRLVSADKYTWSEGRFLWIFSRLASIESDMFDSEERERFLKYAKSGKDFLLRHVLVDPAEDEPRCVFLTDAKGNPKRVRNHEGYDLSISADCFVLMGFAAYARAASDKEAWLFAKRLGESVFNRYESLNCRTLPYPVSSKYISHARPMLLTNVALELYYTAKLFEKSYTDFLFEKIEKYHREIFETFTDENYLVHEFRFAKDLCDENLFVSHINTGHTIEDMWFQTEAADVLGCDTYLETIGKVIKRTMELGWDKEYGGLFHFIPCDGLTTKFEVGDAKDEPQMQLVLDDYSSKLWWVHSEALYTTLLTYFRTKDSAFLEMFRKVFDYTFSTFPNPDKDVGEWIQIRTRRGEPQEKVVALPVKEPYHIIRSIILIIELLEREEKKNDQ